MLDQWIERWREGRTGWHEVDGSALLRRHWPRLVRGSRVLVPLCGKSVDMLWLASQGLEVTGVELSEIAARAFSVAKVAGLGAFATVLSPSITQILEGVAQGNYQSMPKITDLTQNALDKATMWPEGVPGYKLVSAELNAALQFGLDHSG